MTHQHVLAKGFRGQPLDRVMVCARDGLIFVANIASVDKAESGEIPAVGFPETDVFAFDPTIYEALQQEWESAHQTEIATWNSLPKITLPA